MATTKTDNAIRLLQFYMAKAWEAAGLKWQGDNDAETAAVVELIVSAAREELPPLDRKCPRCALAEVSPSCPHCKGSGYLITDAGREVIAFLQRHPAAHTRVG